MPSRATNCVLTVSLLSVALFAEKLPAEDWPSIRGPRFDGSASVTNQDLASGRLGLKVAWKRSFGSGYSGVVTSGDRLVSAMADTGAKREFVVAMSATTGATLWKTPTGPIMRGENGSFDGPLATPAVDKKHAFHLSPFGKLAAYSMTDGAKVWSHDLKNEFRAEGNFYGFGASPIVHKGVLIVAVGAPDGAVMGFASSSGKVLWKVGTDGAAFQSPVVTLIAGEDAVLVACNTMLFAIRPKTGDLIWSQKHGGADGMPASAVIPVPLPDGGVFLADGRDSTTVLNIRDDGADQRWKGRDIRNSYSVPVTAGGLLCSYASRILVAVDPETGKRAWRSRSPGDGFLATIAGRLLVATQKGSLHIGDVSRTGFKEVSSAEVFESGPAGTDGLMWSLPSVSNRSIYLRSLGAIARVDIQSSASSKIATVEPSQVAPDFATFLKSVESVTDKQAAVDRYLTDKSFPLIEDDVVHFILQGDYKDVAVASELFGVRQERTMKRVAGTNLFYFGVAVPGDTRLSYIFYADYKPVADPLNKRRVVSSTLTGEMEPTFMGPGTPLEFSWFDKGSAGEQLPASTDIPPKQLAGTMETMQFDSQAMKESISLQVYLPPGYAGTNTQYPVVFVHEGKIAIEQGNQAAIVDELIQAKRIRPTIVVFIEKRFYPMRGADGYAEMFSTELLPKITERYRISPEREDRASLSGGFGTTLAMMSTLRLGDEISRIGCHSPFAFEMLHPMFGQLSKLPTKRCKLLVQSGKYEYRNPSENWDMSKQATAISKILRDAGHDVLEESTSVGTDWVSWRTQSTKMWEFLAGK